MLCIALTTAFAGVLLVAGCPRGSAPGTPWLLATLGLAFIAGWQRVRVSPHATLSLGFVTVIWALVHFGPHAALAAGAVSGVAIVIAPLLTRPISTLAGIYAVATATAGAGLAGAVYRLAGGVPGSVDVWGMAVPAFAAIATYDLANCGLVALLGGLASRTPIWPHFRSHFALTGRVYWAGAGLAVLAHLTWRVAGAWPIIAIAPIAYCLYLALPHLRPAPPAERA